MPASTLKNLQSHCSKRTESERRDNLYKKKKKKKKKPVFFKTNQKTNRSFSGPPNSSRRRNLEKQKEMRVKDRSDFRLPTKEKGIECTENSFQNKPAHKFAGYFEENWYAKAML